MPAGFQLPPERDLAASLDVSRATVVSAYRELEARGLVRGYVGRGTFVSAKPDTGSAPFAWRGKIAAAALQATDTTVRDLVRAAADPSLMSLAAGVPALDCFPTDAFQRAMTHVLAKSATARGAMARPKGCRGSAPRWRTASAGRRSTSWCSPGAQQGLDLLARCLIDPGDAVIIDRPGYLGAMQTFRNAGARLVGWDITRADFDELEELLLRYRPKLIYTNPTHHNPTGITFAIRTRRELDRALATGVAFIAGPAFTPCSASGQPPRRATSSPNSRIASRPRSTSSYERGITLGWTLPSEMWPQIA